MTNQINSTSSLNFKSTASINEAHKQPNSATPNKVFCELLASKEVTNFTIGSAKNPKSTLPMDTQRGTSIFKKIFSRVAGVLVGTARAALNLLWSPVTFVKYIGVAIVQAYRGEGMRALAALLLAFTSPAWAMVDGMDKAYTRFAAWGDGIRGLTEDNKSDRSELEMAKAYAKYGVIDAEDQRALNIAPFYIGVRLLAQV